MLLSQLKQTSIFVSLLSGAKVRRITGEIGAQERRMMDLPSYHCFFFFHFCRDSASFAHMYKMNMEAAVSEVCMLLAAVMNNTGKVSIYC